MAEPAQITLREGKTVVIVIDDRTYRGILCRDSGDAVGETWHLELLNGSSKEVTLLFL